MSKDSQNGSFLISGSQSQWCVLECNTSHILDSGTPLTGQFSGDVLVVIRKNTAYLTPISLPNNSVSTQFSVLNALLLKTDSEGNNDVFQKYKCAR